MLKLSPTYQISAFPIKKSKFDTENMAYNISYEKLWDMLHIIHVIHTCILIKVRTAKKLACLTILESFLTCST